MADEEKRSADSSGAELRRLDLWQRKLLPFMVVSITVMAAFFFAASLWQLQEFRSDSRTQILGVTATTGAWKNQDERDFMQWRALVELETHVVTRRYEQVRTTMLLRAWTRYVGFLTGMILALVGGVFVLGKLGSGEAAGATELSTQSGAFEGKVATPYPGVALAVLGTTLMALAILVPFDFETRDTPAYVAPLQTHRPVPSEPDSWPAPGAAHVDDTPKSEPAAMHATLDASKDPASALRPPFNAPSIGHAAPPNVSGAPNDIPAPWRLPSASVVESEREK